MKKSLIALAFGTLALGMAEFVMMGILPDIARELGVPVKFAGVGEGIDDLKPFDARSYVEAII